MTEPLEVVQRAFTAYVIERKLGSGGMATVYLAHDKKHDRKVAIKILHAELAAVLGAERFLQEIRVTANLQHPHILGLIDSGLIGEDAGLLTGRPYYVMPYVEGESLRQRLDKEQQLPISDAVRLATEVASALDYAHRRGVIHRDIKPENILLHDGSAVVADFGIALAVTQAGGARITQTGLSLGTPGYMSPEQAMGERTITARSDIYSLGAVTYEMLSGEPPFTGPTVQAVVARVMTEEPRPLTAQRRSVPPQVEAAVSNALEKVPADRFASAHEFAEALNNPSFRLPSAAAQVARERTRRDKWLLYGAAGLATLFLATTVWAWMRPAGSDKPVLRYRLVFDSTEAIVPGASWWTRLAISPDGSRLAYIGGPSGQLLLRPRNQLHTVAVPGSEGAQSPFFSPDGRRVGYLGEQTVRIASLGESVPIIVSDTLTGVAGASWGRDGFIYVDGQQQTPLLRVEAKAGAVPKWFTTLDTLKGEDDHLWPEVLPNGKGVLFAIASRGGMGARPGAGYAIGIAEIPSGKHHVLIDDATHPKYTASGHLLYVTPNRTLMVVPFDQNSMKVTGEPTALIEGLRLGGTGAADLAVSEEGTLVYGTGGAEGLQELVWVTRDGKSQPVDPDWQANFMQPSLSPDGKQVALSVIKLRGIETWTKQLDRGPRIKLTLEETWSVDPTWTPDGRSVTFSSRATRDRHDLWTRRADGSGQATPQFRASDIAVDPRWSPDGRWLIFTRISSPTAADIVAMRPGIDTAPSPMVATAFFEASAAPSPDGRWLAYTSNESGRFEIYVVPFPNTGSARWAVSTRGGAAPLWSRRGTELFYRDATGNLVSVNVKTNPDFSVVGSVPLFSLRGFRDDGLSPQYAVSADGSRFLMIRPLTLIAPDKLIIVENWFEELKTKSQK